MKERHLLGAGAAACAVCCAPPLIGILGLAGIGATAATVAFVGLAFGVVVGAASVLALVVHRRHATREARGSSGSVDITRDPHRRGSDSEHDTIAT